MHKPINVSFSFNGAEEESANPFVNPLVGFH